MRKKKLPLNIGIIGCGYWGPNLVRNFNTIADCHIKYCADIDVHRLKYLQRLYPFLTITKEYRRVIEDPAIDAVAIATPASTHFSIAIEALKAGKNVWIEKPMVASTKEAKILIKEAQMRKLTLFVDHTFIYTGAVRKIKEIINSGAVGGILYFDSIRINLGLFQHDVNVIWDLAPHDLSIMDYLLEVSPIGITAAGMGHYNNIENIAYLNLDFDNNMLAHFHFNWLAPVKLRQILICGDKKMILYNDMEPSEKVKIFDRGITIDNNKRKENIYQTLVSYRTGDVHSPKIDTKEALSVACEHFIECIRYKKTPISDGYAGLEVIKILEAASKSIKTDGKKVKL